MESSTSDRYAKLKEYLTKETYPHLFMFKCVGKNTVDFTNAALRLISEHPGLTEKSRNQTPSGSHVSLTLMLNAPDPNAIIAVYGAMEGMPDLVVIL